MITLQHGCCQNPRTARRPGHHGAVRGAVRRRAGSDRGGHRAAQDAGRSEGASVIGHPGVRRVCHVLRRAADAGSTAGRPVRSPAYHHRQPGRLRPGGTAGRDRRLGRAADGGPLPARGGGGRVGALGAAAAHHRHRRGIATEGGDRRLERCGRIGWRQRLRHRRRYHGPDQLAPGLLGLPADGRSARGHHLAFCPARPRPGPRRVAERGRGGRVHCGRHGRRGRHHPDGPT
jgi:hypothetical protein